MDLIIAVIVGAVLLLFVFGVMIANFHRKNVSDDPRWQEHKLVSEGGCKHQRRHALSAPAESFPHIRASRLPSI